MEVHWLTDFGSMRSFVECEQCNRNFYKKDMTLTCGRFKCDYEAKHESEKIGYNANPSADNSATMQNMVVKMIKDLDTTTCLSNAALKQVI
jgi:hypothetical protein